MSNCVGWERTENAISARLTQPLRSAHESRTLGGVPHLRLIDVPEATGALKEEYDTAVARAGKVFNIVKAMSLRPSVLRQSIELYKAIMLGSSALSRQERELLAVVVSRTNDCHY
jgi:alkylhydroperoxidase family enzyme